MRTTLLCGLLLAASSQAATLTYFPTEQTGGQTANVVVVFSNTAVPGSILGTVSVQPDASDADVGDIRAIFFNLINLPAGLTAAEVLAGISGDDITNTVLNSNTLGGQANVNPLGPFSIGLEFGTSGIGGDDDIQSTTFLINNAALDPDLTLSNLGAVAVRVTSIGAVDSGRGGSGKFLDLQGDLSGITSSPVPEPATYALAGSALVLLVVCKRRRDRNCAKRP